jgi:hypothetical protein
MTVTTAALMCVVYILKAVTLSRQLRFFQSLPALNMTSWWVIAACAKGLRKLPW